MFFSYQRGNRSLGANLSVSKSASATDALTPHMDTQEQKEDYDIPEEVETVIGKFLPPLSVKRLLLQYVLSENWICMCHFYRASAGGT